MRSHTVVRRILRHCGGALFVLWAVITVTFLAVRLIPGDPVQAVLGGPGSQATEEAVAQAKKEYGLDLPLWQQYVLYLGNIARLNFGISYDVKRPVIDVMWEQFPSTLLLAVFALVLAWIIVLLGVYLSVIKPRFFWKPVSAMEQVASVVPQFWLATIFVSIFAVGLGWPIAISTPGIGGMFFPAITLAIPSAGFLGQTVRERLTDTLQQPFITTARARGISPTRLFFVHIFPHILLPAISVSGWAFGTLISGSVVVESIYARAGIGRTLLDAVLIRDVPLVCGILIVVAALYVLIMLITEIAEEAFSG